MKIILIVATKCKNFYTKMHQIRFRLFGNLQRSPDPLAGEEGDMAAHVLIRATDLTMS